MFRLFLSRTLLLFSFLLLSFSTTFANNNYTTIRDPNVRDVNISDNGSYNDKLEEFVRPIQEFFFTADVSGGDGIFAAFTSVAFQVKNFFIGIAVLFLIIWVMKLLFSAGSDDDVKKWKSNIIWVSVGILVMQMAFSFWNVLLIRDTTQQIGSVFAFQIWQNLFLPLIRLLQMLASFAFLMMAVIAFYTIVTGGGDEEKLKKWKMTVIYGLVGFFLIKLPESIVRAIYGSPNCKEGSWFTVWNCEIKEQSLTGTVAIIGKIITYFNTFLTVICVLLIIYAGWQVLISAGDEEKLKKAKWTILYVVVGFIILVASHAIFRFFILKW
jgi:hypothetical protein